MERILRFDKFGYMGKLGNMCFELASSLGIAERCGRKLVLPEWKYGEFFKGKVDIVERNISGKEIREQGFAYCGDYLHLMLNNDEKELEISGYLQSEKYFKHCEDKIREFFSWEEGRFNSIRGKYFELLKEEFIGLHVRRGDYIGHEGYINLPIGYYTSSLRLLPKLPIAIFSDDIDWCKRNFALLARNITYIEGNRNIEDLYLMSKAKHMIVANSTLSWWGAWLGEKNGGNVIHPGAIFKGSMKDYDIKDYYPERWIKNKL